jgi:formylglycine-generating enzyme required for sulfatase activity
MKSAYPLFLALILTMHLSEACAYSPSLTDNYKKEPLSTELQAGMMASADADENMLEPDEPVRLAMQQEQDRKRENLLPANSREASAGLDSCPDCPEIVPIPGNKFAIGKFAVTFREWDACVADGDCGGYQPSDNGWGRGNRPVINVSWNDAQNYIHWLSRKTGKTYRLPSEQEWEIAARAGTTSDYYWGSDIGRNHANCDGCGSEWDNKKTAPVGSFKPNAFGLHDMMGNVWQWTDTCKNGNCTRRVFCGGSWNHRPQDMRAGMCNWFETNKRMRYLGFRLAITLP